MLLLSYKAPLGVGTTDRNCEIHLRVFQVPSSPVCAGPEPNGAP